MPPPGELTPQAVLFCADGSKVFVRPLENERLDRHTLFRIDSTTM